LKKTSILAMAMAMILVLSQSVFCWGPDIPIWTEGTVNCFDVDYNVKTGDMYVAFQQEGEHLILVYRSSNHGKTWSQLTTFGTNRPEGVAPRTDLERIRLLYDDSPEGLDVFFVNSNENLISMRVPLDVYDPYHTVVDIGPVLEGSFDITQNINDGRIFVTWMDGTSNGDNQYVRYSDDNGQTWNPMVNWSWSGGEKRQSLAYGPGSSDHLFWTYAGLEYASPAEITFFRLPASGGMWDIKTRLTNNVFKDYDPRVAAANVDDSGVWVLYNRDRGGHEIDIYFRYSPDAGQTWDPAEYTVSAVDGIDEYIADIKFYRGYPNQWVDMVYIKDDPLLGTDAVWTYTSTGDPSSLRGTQVVNDQDVQPWPEDVAPRIIYSPGASATGGGVVFSYLGRNGLYFDAPWVEAQYTLDITINGSGNVLSTPAGIDCTSSNITLTVTCSNDFATGESVALSATPIDGTNYTSQFIEWSGDCSGSGICVLTMDSDKSVTADFGALGIPVFALPLPSGSNIYPYFPVEAPVKNPEAGLCKPFAVGDVLGGILSLQVGLPPFSGAVDVYLGIYAPVINPDVFIVKPDLGFQLLSFGLVPWISSGWGDIDESLYGDIPVSTWPPGAYELYLLVTAAGDLNLDDYYFWMTYFVVP
jgi:hypothetical protein